MHRESTKFIIARTCQSLQISRSAVDKRLASRLRSLCTTVILSVGQRDALEVRRTSGLIEQVLPRGLFGGGQQPVAVAEAWQRIEQVELRLPFLLHPFGVGEEGARFGPLAEAILVADI